MDHSQHSMDHSQHSMMDLFMPHGHCYFWQPDILWLHTISDAGIVIAYYSIPLALFYFARKRKDFTYRWLLILFGMFIMSCGTTHILGIITTWTPIYRIEGYIKAWTAGVSLLTAIMLWPLIPHALRLPSPSSLKESNDRLQEKTAELERLNEELAKKNALLEQSQEEKFRRLAESLPQIAWTAEPDGRVDYYNQRWKEYSGQPVEKGHGENWQVIVHPEDAGKTVSTWRHAVASGEPYEIEHRIQGRNGEFRWHLSRGVPVKDAHERIIKWYGTATDIHALTTVQQSLRLAEARYRRLVESDIVGIVIMDTHGIIHEANDYFLRMLGWPDSTTHGAGFKNDSITPPQYADADRAALEQLQLRGACTPYEKQFIRHDGSRIWALVGAAMMPDSEGRMVAFVLDISSRKSAEDALHQAHTQLESRVQERTLELQVSNKELESFSYTVSHDLRAPIRAMVGFTQNVLQTQADRMDETGVNHLKRVQAAAQRMGELIDALLDFSRLSRAEMKRQPLDLSQMAEQVVEELRLQEPERQVRIDIAPGLQANGDERLLFVVLQNLIGNAWKFTSKRRDAEIRFESFTEGDIQGFAVRDNGAGFDMQYANKLFGAFQRLHHPDDFPGTGIGLATVQRIILRHAGTVRAEGTEGGGAIFYFTLG